MNYPHQFLFVAAVLLAATAAVAPGDAQAGSLGAGHTGSGSSAAPNAIIAKAPDSPAASVVSAIEPTDLRMIANEVLRRNPDIAAARERARAAAERAPQVSALPDPVAAITPYIVSPETRVGPQQAMVSISEKFPWFGKLHIREQAALYGAAAARAGVEARSLELTTEARRFWYELSFLDQWANIVRTDRETLVHFEEVARTRYAAGVGVEQAAIKLQAEITKDDNRLLDIATRRASDLAALNALRNEPPMTPVSTTSQLAPALVDTNFNRWRSLALVHRPEITRADLEIQQANAMVELAKKEYRPDVTVGLGYTAVGSRQDAAGRAMPPPDNGRDIVAVTASINLPIWKRKLSAGVEEAIHQRNAAEDSKVVVINGIDRSLAELLQRIDLTRRQLDLFEKVLTIQAEQSLESAEAAYAAGTLTALDLLDAERVLLDVRTSTARTRADYEIAIARLEGTTGVPIIADRTRGETSHD